MADLRQRTCCFTGHRAIPEKDLPGILERTEQAVRQLIERGVVFFGVGGAIGYDTEVAKLLFRLRTTDYPQIKVILVYPFEGFTSRWSGEQRAEYARLLPQYDKAVCVAQRVSREAYLTRDRHLVDGSAYCIAYCTQDSGGTAYTLRYARRQGLKIFNTASEGISSVGRGYSYEVLRAKMLFGSQTSKAPLYQRPSKLLKSNDSSPADLKSSETDKLYLLTSSVGQELDDMMKNIPFEVHPTDGGGVIEAPGYYCGKEEEAQPLSGFDLLMFNETHMHDEVKPEIPTVKQEAKVRNPDLELVQNGGAPIDSIIKYYQEHGECI